jgi:AraC family transcriptional regulator
MNPSIATTSARPAPTFPANPLLQTPEPALHAHCPVMHVTYHAQLPERLRQQSDDTIRVLMPGEKAALHVEHRSTDGRARMAFVRGHHVSVIPPHQLFGLSCQRPSDLIVIQLDRAFFEATVREALGVAQPRLVERHAAVDPFLTETGRSLRSEFQVHRNPSAPYLSALAGVIAIHLAKHYSDGQRVVPDHVGLPPHKLSRAQEFIETHLEEGIGVQQVASAIGMSPFHFSRMFKLATGRSPYLYITTRRIERAKELLRSSRLPLVDVAAAVGFQTQGHFTNVFHKYTGMTPRIFRLSAQERDRTPAPSQPGGKTPAHPKSDFALGETARSANGAAIGACA